MAMVNAIGLVLEKRLDKVPNAFRAGGRDAGWVLALQPPGGNNGVSGMG